MTVEPEVLLNRLAQAIFDKKGMNIMALDVRGVSSMTDFFLVAEGNVERHVKALAKAVEDVLNEEGIPTAHIEGMQVGDWVVIDAWSVMIHLFIPTMRNRYQIERIWEEAKIVDLQLDLTSAESEFGFG